jgi:hypothetical protein
MVAQAVGGTVTVSDSTFASADWALSQFIIGGGASVSANQQVSGGNPGAFRFVGDNVANAPSASTFSAILGAHIYSPFSYSPSVTGAITSLDYTEDAICINPNCFGQGQGTGVALRQGGQAYVIGGTITTSSTLWHTLPPLTGLHAADFFLLNPSATSFVDPTSHPDFSGTGAPIQFGFYRSNSTCLGCSGYLLDAGIDNWAVTVHFPSPPGATVPAPWTAGLLVVALAMLGLLRRAP